MEEIDKMQSIPDLESIICSVFGVDLPEPKRGVLLELYVQAVLFCRERSFKKEQTSALLSIIKSIHETNIGSRSELKSLIEKEVREQMSLVSGQLDQQMKEIVDQHSRVQKSPPLNHRAKK
ncbi:hypothetical protein GBF38_011717 [Nibea albiflora]|uniref:Uncharacterized protein n=1 Tax=Nibea albiflora TaxID=240163 RepID=A0ACB7F4Z9_NIBAL|nr:hypothetical protein GBF38_011717 [Nibea albiflora]